MCRTQNLENVDNILHHKMNKVDIVAMEMARNKVLSITVLLASCAHPIGQQWRKQLILFKTLVMDFHRKAALLFLIKVTMWARWYCTVTCSSSRSRNIDTRHVYTVLTSSNAMLFEVCTMCTLLEVSSVHVCLYQLMLQCSLLWLAGNAKGSVQVVWS